VNVILAVESDMIWWEVLVMLQSSLPACLKTPVLQTGSRITSLKLVAGVGVKPT
jgi:hypothetical protein